MTECGNIQTEIALAQDFKISGCNELMGVVNEPPAEGYETALNLNQVLIGIISVDPNDAARGLAAIGGMLLSENDATTEPTSIEVPAANAFG